MKRAEAGLRRSLARCGLGFGVLLSLALPEAGPLARAQEVFPPGVPDFPNQPGPVRLVNPAAMELRVRRVRDAVEVVIENTGTGPRLEQSLRGGSWLGRLYTSRPSLLPRGPQQLGAPEAGLQSVSIDGGGTIYNLRVTPVAGVEPQRPLVSADGRNLVLSFPAPLLPSQSTIRPNSLAPGAVANPAVAPPLRQRAAAPPVGDMAVGTMVLRDPNYLNVNGPPVTLNFKNVPAASALLSLARLGGYGFVYNAKNQELTVTASSFFQSGTGVSSDQTTTSRPTGQIISPPVTASFVNESYRSVINMVLASTGLQAKLVGNTIIAGPDALSSNAGTLASKVYRLNQVSAKSAAEYLASLGALIRVPNTQTTTESQGTSTNTGGGSASGGQTASNTTTISSSSVIIQTLGGGGGPLSGLSGTTDRRLGTITLVGPPNLVAIGEQYLRQMDLRQRQVALSIRILDVSLGNDTSIENSFAFRSGNNFIVSDRGEFVGAFGSLLPPSTNPQSSGAFDRDIPRDFSFEVDPITGRITSDITQGFNALGGAANNALSAQPGGTVFKGATPRNQGLLYPNQNFFDFVRAQITSRSTKVLASPTLILSENAEEIPGGGGSGGGGGGASGLGQISTNNYLPSIGRRNANESAVVVGEQVITNYSVQAGQNGAPNSCQPEFQIAGLTFGAKVSKIDDNGFVTFSLSPAITATVDRSTIEGCGPINILSVRSLDTGNARVRDGQTLILTGVISDRDLSDVRKWPVLGDLPIVGQFFRRTDGGREKRELVVMVTPRIINDNEGGTYGYGFEPSSRDTRTFMNPSPSSTRPRDFIQR